MIAVMTHSHPAIIAAILVPLTFLLTLTLGRWLKRRHGVQFGFAYLLFCGALSLYLPLLLFGKDLFPERYQPLNQATYSQDFQDLQKQITQLQDKLKLAQQTLDQRASTTNPALTYTSINRHLGAALVLLGTLVAIALIRRYFWELWMVRVHHSPAPKFLSQIFGLFIFIAALMAVIAINYEKDLTAFVFGSTVVVGIIGFAMQDLLGNIIAGIALEIGKPFKTGDWLVIENRQAEVIEVNWRSTRLRTNDDVCLDLPNKSIAGASIVNLSYPTSQYAIRLRVHFDTTVQPNLIKDCLLSAAARAQGVLSSPPPKAFLVDFAESAVIYEIKAWINNNAHLNDICDAIRTNVWYEAQRHKIRIPFPLRTLHIERPSSQKTETLETARAALRKQPVWKCLDETQSQQLLASAKLQKFGRGERMIQQGDSGHSMFFVVSGEADVYVHQGQQDTYIATIKPGDFFGEMSLLTGEPRSATVVARFDCEILEIEKPVLSDILQNNEGLAKKLSELLAKRRLATEGILLAATEPEVTVKQREYSEGILQKLYSFFEL